MTLQLEYKNTEVILFTKTKQSFHPSFTNPPFMYKYFLSTKHLFLTDGFLNPGVLSLQT